MIEIVDLKETVDFFSKRNDELYKENNDLLKHIENMEDTIEKLKNTIDDKRIEINKLKKEMQKVPGVSGSSIDKLVHVLHKKIKANEVPPTYHEDAYGNPTDSSGRRLYRYN